MREKDELDVRFYALTNGVIPTGFSCNPVRRDSHLEALCGPTDDGKKSAPPRVKFRCASGWYSTTDARLFAKAIIEICDKADSLWQQIKDHPRQEPLA